MESLWLQICDIQGRLFKLAWKAGYDSEDFMKQFMRSRVARDLDSEYNRMCLRSSHALPDQPS